MDSLHRLKNKTFTEDLIYILSGFDTQNIFILGDPPTINSSLYSPEMIHPFEFLIFKIREFYRVNEFEKYIQIYLKKLATLKHTVDTPEELYIRLQDDIDVFRDLDRIHTLALKSSADFPFSTNKHLLVNISPEILKKFQHTETLKILESINKWVNQADPTDLIEVKKLDDFSSSHWKDLFKIKQINLSKEQLEGIEECGKIVFLIRMLFNMETVSDEAPRDSSVLPIGMINYSGDIAPRRRLMLSILSDLTAKRIFSEIKMVQDIALLQDGPFFQDIFHIFESELFSGESISDKMNTHLKKDSFVVFRECESTLGDYIMKLLKFQKMPVQNQHLVNLQKIGISFQGGLLGYFVPKKTLVELEILFRFLFIIASSSYYLQASKWYNFTRVIYLIFTKVREKAINFVPRFFNEKYTNECDGSIDYSTDALHGFSIDSLSTEFVSMTSSCLNRFYITNSEIFPVWVRMIDVALEYLQIEYKDCIVESHFNDQLKDCVNEMVFKITKNYGEGEFTDFLKNIEVEKYL